MRIIPAIDLIGGQCVRLRKGNYAAKTVYDLDPLEVAQGIENEGVKYLHLVDLDGAKDGGLRNFTVLKRLAAETTLQIDYSGGIRTLQDVEAVLEAGASQVAIGSLAVTQKELFKEILNCFGSDKIILSADVKDRKIAFHGWKEDSGESLEDFLSYWEGHAVKHVICTDISRDGLLAGVDINFYKRLVSKYSSLAFVASGGVTSLDDLSNLAEINIAGVIIGKALYEKRFALADLSRWLC